MKPWTTFVTLFASALALSACSAPPPRERIILQPVEIVLRDPPRVAERTMLGATLSFPFRVTNPNTVAILLEHMNLDASINGSSLGRNLATCACTIGPGETANVPVRYDVSFISAGVAVIDAVASEQAAIIVDGTASLSCADNRFTANPLEHPFQIR